MTTRIVVAVNGNFRRIVYDPGGISPSVIAGHDVVPKIAVRKEIAGQVVYGKLYDERDRHFVYPLPKSRAEIARRIREAEESEIKSLEEWFT